MAAIECQAHYIETRLGVPLAPVPDLEDGREDGRDEPTRMIVCAYCGTVGHPQAECDEWKAERDY
jgi:hypothetical protein